MLQGPAAIDIFYDAIEYRNVKLYQKKMPMDQAYKESVKQVEKGQGFWARTKFTLLYEIRFHLRAIRSIRDIVLQTSEVRTRKRASTKALLDKSSSREQVE